MGNGGVFGPFVVVPPNLIATWDLASDLPGALQSGDLTEGVG